MELSVRGKTYVAQGLRWGLLLSWLVVAGVWLFGGIALSELEAGMVILGVFTAAALMYVGKGRFTAWVGTSVMGIGALAFLSDSMVAGLFASLEPVRLLALALLFTGIVLERVSPMPALPPWIFVLVAAKAEFIIVSSLVVSIIEAGYTFLEFSVLIWWLLVLLMVLAAIALGLEQRTIYTVLWYVCVLVSALLLMLLLPFISLTAQITWWAVAATIWPPVALRLVEKKLAI